jgi:predicted nucleic-acid-binding Zn-ribbon protein
MPYVIKCKHCDYVEYIEKGGVITRCPKCGSPAAQVKSPYETESIKVKIMDTRGQNRNITVTFHDLVSIVNSIIGTGLNASIPVTHKRERVIYMIKVYLWILLKKSPQLWLDIDTAINGIKELMLLKLSAQEN